jgi:flavodoxin
MIAGLELPRLAGALASAAAYAALCLLVWRRESAKRSVAQAEAESLRPAAKGAGSVLVAYASQTGQAEGIARQTASLLHDAGKSVQLLPLASVRAEQLAAATQVLFIVSTYGEGDAPDNAARFVDEVMADPLALPSLRYALLALGDRTYAHFCGFGRALHEWLRASNAVALFAPEEVDMAEPDALANWWERLGAAASVQPPAVPAPQPFEAWTLAHRECLNPGSAGEPMYYLELAPPLDSLPTGSRATSWRSSLPVAAGARANIRSRRFPPMAACICSCGASGAATDRPAWSPAGSRTALRWATPCGCARGSIRISASPATRTAPFC